MELLHVTDYAPSYSCCFCLPSLFTLPPTHPSSLSTIMACQFVVTVVYTVGSDLSNDICSLQNVLDK